MPASTSDKNIARFQFVQNCFKGFIEVLDGPDLTHRQYDTPALIC